MTRNAEQTYNGWTNYATWRVMLEVFSDYSDRDEAVTPESCEALTDDLLTMDGNKNRLAIDYARAFLSDVNWHEIANAVNEANDLTSNV